MLVLLVLAHPDPGSFNHALAGVVRDELVRGGHEVIVHDLCRENFDAQLTSAELARDATLSPGLQRHCDELRAAEGLVFVHPNWWGQPPAVLKGWVDRVLRPGVAYRFEDGDGGEGVPVGLLRASTAMVLNTSNTSAARETAVFGDPLELIWRHCILGLCGVERVLRKMFRVVVTSSMEQRRLWLDEAVALTRQAFPAGATPPARDARRWRLGGGFTE